MQQELFPSIRPIAQMAFIFILRLVVRPVLDLVGNAASPSFSFLPGMARLVSALIGVLEVFSP